VITLPVDNTASAIFVSLANVTVLVNDFEIPNRIVRRIVVTVVQLGAHWIVVLHWQLIGMNDQGALAQGALTSLK
jgi:hypothetical protein